MNLHMPQPLATTSLSTPIALQTPRLIEFGAGVAPTAGRWVALLSGRMDSGVKQRQRNEQALATIASLVGALVLARAVNDPKLSDDILRTTKNRLNS